MYFVDFTAFDRGRSFRRLSWQVNSQSGRIQQIQTPEVKWTYENNSQFTLTHTASQKVYSSLNAFIENHKKSGNVLNSDLIRSRRCWLLTRCLWTTRCCCRIEAFRLTCGYTFSLTGFLSAGRCTFWQGNTLWQTSHNWKLIQVNHFIFYFHNEGSWPKFKSIKKILFKYKNAHCWYHYYYSHDDDEYYYYYHI